MNKLYLVFRDLFCNYKENLRKWFVSLGLNKLRVLLIDISIKYSLIIELELIKNYFLKNNVSISY